MGISEDYIYLKLPREILALDNSIRFCGVSNKLGHIVSHVFRKGLQPMMTLEETERYAMLATIRHGTRTVWEGKLGGTEYSLTRYNRLIRITIPLDASHLLLISMDVGTANFDEIIMKKVLPFIKRQTPAAN